jgi:hypothetical protein
VGWKSVACGSSFYKPVMLSFGVFSETSVFPITQTGYGTCYGQRLDFVMALDFATTKPTPRQDKFRNKNCGDPLYFFY